MYFSEEIENNKYYMQIIRLPRLILLPETAEKIVLILLKNNRPSASGGEIGSVHYKGCQ